jgi:hypothetical protein
MGNMYLNTDLEKSQLWPSYKLDVQTAQVLATGTGLDWKNGLLWFQTRPKPDPLTLCGPNLDQYLSTHRFCLVWLDPLVPISGSAFPVSHSSSH